MVTNPFNSQHLEVMVTEEVTREGQIVPTRPVYEPGKVIDYIKANGNRFSTFELEQFFAGIKLPALAAFTDLDVSGLIEPTEEFQGSPDGKFYRVYRLTRLGQEVDYARLMPRMNITYASLPNTVGVLNRALKMGGDFGEMLGVLESLGSQERQAVKQELLRLWFQTYNSQ